MDPFLGQIIMFGGNFAPRGWALCDGQLLSINQYQALFSILGTTYGGDGRTTFGLPDLRSRVPVHAGNGPGLSDRRLGAKGGTETVTLTTQQIPSHNHAITNAAGSVKVGNEGKGVATESTAAGNYLGNSTDAYRTADGGATLAAGSVEISGNTNSNGGGQSHNNMQPYQVVNYIIALQGTFPSRN